MANELLIENLDLSVRSFNSLRKAGFSTLEEVWNKISFGCMEIIQLLRSGNKVFKEVLWFLQQSKFPAHVFVDEYGGPFSEEERVEWKNKYTSCYSIIKYVNDCSDEALFSKTIWFESCPFPGGVRFAEKTVKALETLGVFSVTEIIEKYASMSDIPLQDGFKLDIIMGLDRAGLRLKDCSFEDYPDIRAYISIHKAKSQQVESLNVGNNIIERLSANNIKVVDLITSPVDQICPLFDIFELVKLIQYIKKHYYLKWYDYNKYPEAQDYVVDKIEIPIEILNLHHKTRRKLLDHGVKTVNSLLELSRIELSDISNNAVLTIIDALLQNNLHLKDEKICSCSHCGKETSSKKSIDHNDVLCNECLEKKERIEGIKDFSVTIDSLYYGSYTNGVKGFTIAATLSNNTNQIEEFELIDFKVHHEGRLWAACDYFKGYSFFREQILPYTSQTAVNVWSDKMWKNKRIQDDDYVVFTVLNKGKKHTFKFVFKNSSFELDDYNLWR